MNPDKIEQTIRDATEFLKQDWTSEMKSDNESYDLAEEYVLEIINAESKEESEVKVNNMEECDCIPIRVVAADGCRWRPEKIEWHSPGIFGGGSRGLVVTYRSQ